MTSQSDIDSTARELGVRLGDRGVNLLINNAGLTRKRQYVGNLNREHLLEQFDVNAVGPLLLTQVIDRTLLWIYIYTFSNLMHIHLVKEFNKI